MWNFTKHEPNEDQEINAGAKYYSRIYWTCLFEGNENAWRYQTVNRKKDTQYNGEREKGQIKVITKLPNSEQSYKGKVKTHNYINRQNQSTTGKLWKP